MSVVCNLQCHLFHSSVTTTSRYITFYSLILLRPIKGKVNNIRRDTQIEQAQSIILAAENTVASCGRKGKKINGLNAM